jgi:hypothetical protein
VILVYNSVMVPKVSCSRFVVVSLIRIILVLFFKGPLLPVHPCRGAVVYVFCSVRVVVKLVAEVSFCYCCCNFGGWCFLLFLLLVCYCGMVFICQSSCHLFLLVLFFPHLWSLLVLLTSHLCRRHLLEVIRSILLRLLWFHHLKFHLFSFCLR